MIRLTVEQITALRDSIQATDQVQCALLPLEATYVKSLIVAWARGRENDSAVYLSIWKDTTSLIKAKKEEDPKGTIFAVTQDGQASYSHVYRVEEESDAFDSEEEEVQAGDV